MLFFKLLQSMDRNYRSVFPYLARLAQNLLANLAIPSMRLIKASLPFNSLQKDFAANTASLKVKKIAGIAETWGPCSGRMDNIVRLKKNMDPEKTS